MYPVSQGFLEALRAPSSRMVTAVYAIDEQGALTPLAVDRGAVDMDASRAIIRTCSLELTATEDLTVEEVLQLVTRPGIEIRVERGLLVDGVPELVPLGIFSTDTASASRRVTGAVSWRGSDRSKKIARARFVSPYQVSAGVAVADALEALLVSRWAPCPTDFSTVAGSLSAAIVWDAGPESDPWREARTLAADYGYELSFDGLGIARARLIPDPATAASVFDYGDGETQLVLDATVSTTLERTYNGVVASGEGSDVMVPVRAVVWDTDPASPTYYLGGFGRAPYFYSSPQLTTVGQCELAASTILARVKGRAQGLAWEAVVNPALEPLDVVTTTAGGSLSRVVIDKLSVPLRAADAARAVARETAVTT